MTTSANGTRSAAAPDGAQPPGTLSAATAGTPGAVGTPGTLSAAGVADTLGGAPPPGAPSPAGAADTPGAVVVSTAAETLGGWLRRQRQARGWAVPEMTRKLREVAGEVGDTLPVHDALVSMVRKWERGRGGVSERYRLHLSRLFGVPVDQFGTSKPVLTLQPADPSVESPAGPVVPATSHLAPVVPHVWSVMAPSIDVAYRGIEEPSPCGSQILREVLIAVTDSSAHAEQAEHREIGDITLEQFRADVIRLSSAYMTGEPLFLLMEMRALRQRMHDALDRKLWPRDQAEIYLLLGCLTGLTSAVVQDLGYGQAAEDLLRSAWAYALVIDHKPLMAYLRERLSSVCFWGGQPHRARDYAADGLRYQATGPTAAHLHVNYAQAASRLGETDDARRAVATATDAREPGRGDDVTELGGEFRLSLATQHAVAGSALAEFDNALSDAARELDEAARRYAAGPEPGEQHWFAGHTLADIGRTIVRLRSGALDGAMVALDPVLALPRGQRITVVTTGLGRVRQELAAPVYRGSAQASKLGERIEEFCGQTIVTDLHGLPGG